MRKINILVLLCFALAGSSATAQSLTCPERFRELGRKQWNQGRRIYVLVETTKVLGHDQYVRFSKGCRLGTSTNGFHNCQSRAEFDFLAGAFGGLLRDAWVGGVFTDWAPNLGWVTEDGTRTLIYDAEKIGGWCKTSCFAPGEPNWDGKFLGYSKKHAGRYADKGQGGQGGMVRSLLEFTY